MEERLKDFKPTKRSSDDAKDTISHRGLVKTEERSCSEPPSLASTSKRSRLATIKEKIIDESSDCELSKSNNQLNESDLELEVDGSTSTMMQTTPTPSLIAAYCSARRINSETNLNDASRRFSGFLGNKSKRFCSSTSELNFSSHLDTRKSLFSPRNNALSRQSFNSSIYGSNLSLNSSNSRLFMTNSPFYDGKTMYGGASAYTKRDTTQHKFLRVPVLMRPTRTNEVKSAGPEDDNSKLPESNATKRILEIMNDFKGPLKEARSMGTNISSFLNSSMLAAQSKKRFSEDDREKSLSQRNFLAMSDAAKSESNRDVFNSYLAASPPIPTMSQLLRMKKLQSNTEKVREIANRSECFLNKNTEYKLPTINENEAKAGSSTMKMKNNIVKNLIRIDNKRVDDMPPETVNLPNIQLPLKNIPKFDIPTISKPTQSSLLSTSTSPSSTTKMKAAKSLMTTAQGNSPIAQKEYKMEMPTISSKKIDKVEEFKFSKPLSLKNENFSMSKSFAKSFTFAKPSSNLDSTPNCVNSVISSPSKPLLSSEVKKKKFSMDEESQVVDLCCDNAVKDATKLRENGIAQPIRKDDLFASLAQKQNSQKWECDVCMLRNDQNCVKCASCESPKPGSTKSEVKSSLSSTVFSNKPAKNQIPTDDLFKSIVMKQKSENWECAMCLTRNEAAQSKCVCCDTSKPNAVMSSPKPTNSSLKEDEPMDEGFKKLVSKQSAMWECSACMTRNNSSASKCACCEQPKPNTESSSSQFSFGSSLSSKVSLPDPAQVKFAFGMTNTVELPKPVDVQFSFGMGKNTEPVKSTEAITTETVKKADTGFSSFSTMSDQTDSQKSSENLEKKEVQLPAATFGGFKFGVPSKTLPQQIDENKPTAISTCLMLPQADLKKDSSPHEIVKTDNLTKSNDNSIFSNSLNDTSKTSSFSFNAGPELNKTSSIFSKSETSSVIFNAEPITTPTISFGSTINNVSSPQVITNNNNNVSLFGVKNDKTVVADKPAGGFSFGSNSTTSSSLFTFGSKISNSEEKPTSAPVVFGASPSFSSLASNNNNNNNSSSEFVFGGQQKTPEVSPFPVTATSNTQNNFQFNAPNELKSTFSFSQKQPVQSFSFNSSSNMIAADNKNIFHFGQAADKVTLPIVSDATQLGGVENAEIPNIINPLGAFGKTTQNPRKILRVRRTVQRR